MHWDEGYNERYMAGLALAEKDPPSLPS